MVRAGSAGGVRWLSRQQEQRWRSIAQFVGEVRGALEVQLERDADLSMIEYHALARLSEESDWRLRMSSLAVLTNASLSRLSHLITRLERRGFVRRESDPSDGRFTLAVMTKAGHKKLLAAAPGHVACVRALFIDEFTASELKMLQTFCDRVVARIAESDWKLT